MITACRYGQPLIPVNCRRIANVQAKLPSLKSAHRDSTTTSCRASGRTSQSAVNFVHTTMRELTHIPRFCISQPGSSCCMSMCHDRPTTCSSTKSSTAFYTTACRNGMSSTVYTALTQLRKELLSVLTHVDGSAENPCLSSFASLLAQKGGDGHFDSHGQLTNFDLNSR